MTTATTPDEIVSEKVRVEVARHRVSQRALADATGLTQQGVSRRLTGQVPFTATQLAAVATVLGVPTADLLP